MPYDGLTPDGPAAPGPLPPPRTHTRLSRRFPVADGDSGDQMGAAASAAGGGRGSGAREGGQWAGGPGGRRGWQWVTPTPTQGMSRTRTKRPRKGSESTQGPGHVETGAGQTSPQWGGITLICVKPSPQCITHTFRVDMHKKGSPRPPRESHTPLFFPCLTQ